MWPICTVATFMVARTSVLATADGLTRANLDIVEGERSVYRGEHSPICDRRAYRASSSLRARGRFGRFPISRRVWFADVCAATDSPWVACGLEFAQRTRRESKLVAVGDFLVRLDDRPAHDRQPRCRTTSVRRRGRRRCVLCGESRLPDAVLAGDRCLDSRGRRNSGPSPADCTESPTRMTTETTSSGAKDQY